MDITVRAAQAADITTLCGIEEECFSMPWSEKSFEDFFANGVSRCLVAVFNDEICGYVGMNLIFGEGEITNLAVREKYRRKGVGKALMDALAATEGLRRILLDVRESNVSARSLYEKCGFSVDGIRKNFYSKPRENAVLMSFEIHKQVQGK